MKYFLLTITSCILSIHVFAQNWQTFNSKVQYVFKNTTYDSFVVFDSVKVQGADTLLYNFKTIRQVRETFPGITYSFSTISPTWVGHAIVVKSNGLNIFLNDDKDSVYVNTKAGLGSTFTVYNNVTKKLNIIGRVDSIVSGKVLGITDSLKYITLFTNGHAGYGTKQDSVTSIVLSKSYGFVSALTFLNVGIDFLGNDKPYKNNTFLKGQSKIPDTYKNLQVVDIYDFNIGDEFHTFKLSNTGINTKTITKVLSKALSADGDTLIYSMDVCEAGNGFATHGTKNAKYLLDNASDRINSIPGKVYYTASGPQNSNYPQIASLQKSDTLILDIINSNYYDCIKADSCFKGITESTDLSYTYIKGLGGSYYYNNTRSPASPGFYYESNTLVYSKKGTVETGTPYDCDILLAVNDPQLSSSKTKIYPNPAKDKLTIEASKTSNLSIKNIIGVEVYKGSINAGENEINVSALVSGVYFVFITTGNTTYTEKIVIN